MNDVAGGGVRRRADAGEKPSPCFSTFGDPIGKHPGADGG